MNPHQDPHAIDLAVLFPSYPPEEREAVRRFLDAYCEVALKVFERLEREAVSRIDPAAEPD